ncbi:hypothetical protein D3C87_1942040 [compost metagenome]
MRRGIGHNIHDSGLAHRPGTREFLVATACTGAAPGGTRKQFAVFRSTEYRDYAAVAYAPSRAVE